MLKEGKSTTVFLSWATSVWRRRRLVCCMHAESTRRPGRFALLMLIRPGSHSKNYMHVGASVDSRFGAEMALEQPWLADGGSRAPAAASLPLRVAGWWLLRLFWALSACLTLVRIAV